MASTSNASNSSNIEFKPYRSRNSWSPYKLGKLIKLYRLSPALWDSKHEGFCKRDVRKQAYVHIAEFFGKKSDAGVDLISRKLNTLRNSFKIELDKVLAGGKSQWEFYEALNFLTDHVKKGAASAEQLKSPDKPNTNPTTATPSSGIRAPLNEISIGAVDQKPDIPNVVVNDETQQFCNYLASRMRKLPENKQEELKDEISASLARIRKG